MRTIYARTESAVPLASGERVVGVVDRPGTLTEYVVGEVLPECTIAAIRRTLPSTLLSALVPPSWPRHSDHDAWQWRAPEERRSRRVTRLTHAGRERKRARG